MRITLEIPVSVYAEGIDLPVRVEVKKALKHFPLHLKRLIETRWRKRKKEAKEAGEKPPFAGRIYHLTGYHNPGMTGKEIAVEISPTTYKCWLGLQGTCEQLYAIGTGAYLITSDGMTCFSIRGKSVEQPGKYSIIGGTVEPEDKEKDKISPLANIRKELMEEAGIKENEVSISSLGLSRSERPPVLDFPFEVRTCLTSEGVEKCFQTAQDAYESEKRIWLENDPGIVRSFLLGNYQKFKPQDFACAVFAGRHLWGPDWLKIY